MANPTRYRNWILPRPAENPWYAKFAQLWQDVDTAMAFAALYVPILDAQLTQVETSAPAHVSVILSARPTGATTIHFEPNDPLREFITVSVAPMGPIAGSFSIVGSGRNLFLRTSYVLHCTNSNGGPTLPALQAGFDAQARIVITGGPVGHRVETHTVGGSAWSMTTCLGRADTRVHFEDVVSLGPGNYSAVFQLLATPSDQTSFRKLTVSSDHTITCFALEGMTSHGY